LEADGREVEVGVKRCVGRGDSGVARGVASSAAKRVVNMSDRTVEGCE
jgi:hypothetical protein